MQRHALLLDLGQRPNGFVNVLLARFIRNHHDRDRLLLAIGLQPDPNTIARRELLEPAPPAGNLDFGFGHQLPRLGELVALDEQPDAPLRRIDGLEYGKVLGHRAQELRDASDLLDLHLDRFGIVGADN